MLPINVILGPMKTVDLVVVVVVVVVANVDVVALLVTGRIIVQLGLRLSWTLEYGFTHHNHLPPLGSNFSAVTKPILIKL